MNETQLHQLHAFIEAKRPTQAQYEHAFEIIQWPCWKDSALAKRVDARILRYLQETKAYIQHLYDDLINAPHPLPDVERQIETLRQRDVGELCEHPFWRDGGFDY